TRWPRDWSSDVCSSDLMRHAIAVEGLTKRFRAAVVVRDVSFAVAPGEIVGLLGPNGAGKTTTIQMLLGIIRPTAGRIEILGLDQIGRVSCRERVEGLMG